MFDGDETGLRRGGAGFADEWYGWLTAQDAAKKDAPKKDEKVVVTGTAVTPPVVPAADSTTEGTVTVGGQAIAYKAVAGTLTVGSSDCRTR